MDLSRLELWHQCKAGKPRLIATLAEGAEVQRWSSQSGLCANVFSLRHFYHRLHDDIHLSKCLLVKSHTAPVFLVGRAAFMGVWVLPSLSCDRLVTGAVVSFGPLRLKKKKTQRRQTCLRQGETQALWAEALSAGIKSLSPVTHCSYNVNGSITIKHTG